MQHCCWSLTCKIKSGLSSSIHIYFNFMASGNAISTKTWYFCEEDQWNMFVIKVLILEPMRKSWFWRILEMKRRIKFVLLQWVNIVTLPKLLTPFWRATQTQAQTVDSRNGYSMASAGITHSCSRFATFTVWSFQIKIHKSQRAAAKFYDMLEPFSRKSLLIILWFKIIISFHFLLFERNKTKDLYISHSVHEIHNDDANKYLKITFSFNTHTHTQHALRFTIKGK